MGNMMQTQPITPLIVTVCERAKTATELAAAVPKLPDDQAEVILKGIELARVRLLRLEAVILSHRVLAEEKAEHV